MKKSSHNQIKHFGFIMGLFLIILGALTLAGCSKASSSTTPDEVATAIKIIENDKLLTPEQKAAKIKRLQAPEQK